ncbi:MAG TPA: hypothetical protein VMV05_12530 [bacterium]|nr:hypothetical protein [bacterium]
MKKSQLYAVVGFLIGWGAPVGALFLRYLFWNGSTPLMAFVNREWTQFAFFYWYMLIGTCLVLTWVGYLLGNVEDMETGGPD